MDQQGRAVGVLQGLTEFLPISSSAHLAIFPKFFGWDDPGAAFTAVVQIGMDTPQVSPDLLAECVDGLRDDDAVLGMARDGGWWVLGVRWDGGAKPRSSE